MTLTIERVIKKVVRRNEYSIVINTGFRMGVSFPVDCVDIIADKMTTRNKRQFNAYAFDLALFVHFFRPAIISPGRGAINNET